MAGRRHGARADGSASPAAATSKLATLQADEVDGRDRRLAATRDSQRADKALHGQHRRQRRRRYAATRGQEFGGGQRHRDASSGVRLRGRGWSLRRRRRELPRRLGQSSDVRSRRAPIWRHPEFTRGAARHGRAPPSASPPGA
ncbi:MAG: hypothetical protein MZW92_21605 [Comamonadaceae bacterium]|nr:hypothetical protein [Comamonadaceae bacterium]